MGFTVLCFEVELRVLFDRLDVKYKGKRPHMASQAPGGAVYIDLVMNGSPGVVECCCPGKNQGWSLDFDLSNCMIVGAFY